jgi:putative transposase
LGVSVRSETPQTETRPESDAYSDEERSGDAPPSFPIETENSDHFVTTVTRVRGSWFCDPRICLEALRLFEKYRALDGLICYGYVLMPDHVHSVLKQPFAGPMVSRFMANMKRETSLRARELLGDVFPGWCDRYDDVYLPNSEAVRERLRYMHLNPVRRGLVEAPEDYGWSSARDHYELGAGCIQVAWPF